MNGVPIVDIVLLLFLVVFFGIQQRNRPELFFRFWFAGWLAVSLSFVIWMVPTATIAGTAWHDALTTDMTLLAGLAFLLSFLVTDERLPRTMLIGFTFLVPVSLVLDVDIISRPRSWAIRILLLLGQAAGIHAIHTLFPKAWRWQRLVNKSLCVIFGAAMLAVQPGDTNQVVPTLVVAEIFLSIAILYAATHLRRSFAGLVGSIGFLGWAAFYLIAIWIPEGSAHLKLLYQFWDVPKYFVGFAMILQISEQSRIDMARLATVYKDLYKDFRLMYQNHPHPMWIYERSTKGLLSVNAAAVSNYGFTEQELLQMKSTDLELTEDGELEVTNRLIPVPADGRRMRHRRKDGSAVWVNVAESPTVFQGQEACCVIARDVTEQMNVNRELAHRAHHDALTGLLNRSLLDNRIQQCFERCSREERKAVLITIDVDHFKSINDTYGHHVGDECLRTVAHRLKSKIRQVDTIARTGGEEFVAIVGGLRTAADARKVTASLLSMFEAPLSTSCGLIPLTVSIGGALFPDDGIEVSELQRKSDQALYAAKRGGRNRATFATAEVIPILREPQNKTWLAQPRESMHS